MSEYPAPLNLRRVRVYPLAQRRSLSRIEGILVDPDSIPPSGSLKVSALIGECAKRIVAARRKNAGALFLYGAHLVRNGAAALCAVR